MRKLELQVPRAIGDELMVQFAEVPTVVAMSLTPCELPPGHCRIGVVVPDVAFNEMMALIKESGALDAGIVSSVVLASAEGAAVERLAGELGSAEAEAVNWDEVIQALERETAPGVAFHAFIVMASVIATCALLLGSIPVLIGAMVIPPALSALLSIPVALQMRKWQLARRGLFATALTLGLATAVAWGAAELLGRFALAPEAGSILRTEMIADRISVNVYAYVVALASGIAGGFSLVTNRPSQLVGVMIAAALIPSAATAGLGLAENDLAVARGAAHLMAVNVLFIVAGGFVAVLWFRLMDRLAERRR